MPQKKFLATTARITKTNPVVQEMIKQWAAGKLSPTVMIYSAFGEYYLCDEDYRILPGLQGFKARSEAVEYKSRAHDVALKLVLKD